MRRTQILTLLFTLLVPIKPSAQTPRPGGARSAGLKTDIRQVDFKNLSYNVNAKLVLMRKGKGEYVSRRDKYESFSANVDKIIYGDLTGDGKDEAAVVVGYRGSGTGSFNDGFIYILRNGRPELLATFKGGDRADGSIADVKIQGGLLIVERLAPEAPGVGLCCPEYIDTTRHQWRGSQLVQVGNKQRRRYH